MEDNKNDSAPVLLAYGILDASNEQRGFKKREVPREPDEATSDGIIPEDTDLDPDEFPEANIEE